MLHIEVSYTTWWVYKLLIHRGPKLEVICMCWTQRGCRFYNCGRNKSDGIAWLSHAKPSKLTKYAVAASRDEVFSIYELCYSASVKTV